MQDTDSIYVTIPVGGIKWATSTDDTSVVVGGYHVITVYPGRISESTQIKIRLVGSDEPPKRIVRFYIENDSLKFKSDYPATEMVDSLRAAMNRGWTAHLGCQKRYEHLKSQAYLLSGSFLILAIVATVCFFRILHLYKRNK